ncbi:MAG: F0F1 ATP synthase subunit delta [Clostridia bacterium]|nr:F0F1 ATP synthase subunit delta [Clostridia bacterium]
MTEFGREYGDGLYALCVEEALVKPVAEELAGLKAIFRENPDFIRLLGNLSIPKDERTRVVDEALGAEVHP